MAGIKAIGRLALFRRSGAGPGGIAGQSGGCIRRLPELPFYRKHIPCESPDIGGMALKIYLAGPFFNETERKNHDAALSILQKKGLDVYAPFHHQRSREGLSRREWAEATFQDDAAAIRGADAVVLLFYGMYSDSGTAWECGFAYALGKKSWRYICTKANRIVW